MKLSVVIPAHNEAESIEATVIDVAGTLAAEEIPFEIVVVDDASRDGTGDVVAQITERWPQVRCHRSHNRGASATPYAPASTYTPAMPSRS